MPDTAAKAAAPPLWRRLLPLAVLLAALAAFLAFGGWRYVNLETLRENQQALTGWVEANFWLAAVVYALIYALAVSISVPGAIWFTIASGFLFGPYAGTVIAVLGSTAGATIIFLAVRMAFAEWAQRRFSGWVETLRRGFRRDAFTYVLILRLIPVLPFFGINIATALLNVPLRAYVLGTLIGVIPLAYVYATVGATVSNLAALGEAPGLGDVLTLEVIAALLVFALVALLPLIYKRVAGRRPAPDPEAETPR